MIDESLLRVAVVGAGPAGYYAAGHLLADATRPVTVDLFDRLPTPWGLVRSGVAPDHPKLKAVSAVFERTAALAGCRFFGNVCIGTDLTRHDLLRHYHAVIYATGAETDRKLAIPGEDLPGSHSALEFVGWYNGHPDFEGREFDLSCERGVVVGNGNVALDLARMLSLTGYELARTDISDDALSRLAQSAVREVVVVGRRGPAQAAFTSPELSELALLESVDVEVHDPSALGLGHPDPVGAETLRKLDLLRGFAGGLAGVAGVAGAGGAGSAGGARALATTAPGAAASEGGGGATGSPAGRARCRRLVQFRFLSAPVEIRGAGRVEEIVLERNELRSDGDGGYRAHPTGEREVLATGLVLRAVGYAGAPLDGVPFDQARGTIAHRGGRVWSPSGGPSPGEYCVGWVKRGPAGVIGTNKRDALETVTALLDDWEAGLLNVADEPLPEAIVGLLSAQGTRVVDQRAWQRIDAHERRRGEPAGRPRVKACGWEELLLLAEGG